MRCCFGYVLGGSGGRFSELFGRFWVDFGALKRRPSLKSKLEAEKVVRSTRRGSWPESRAALILVNDHPSLASLIVDHWNH